MILFVIMKCQMTTLGTVILMSVLFCRQVTGETAEEGSWVRLQRVVKE